MKILQKLLTRRWRGKSHLAAFMLAATVAATAWSATPLAVWNGDFNDAATRNGVTFDANGNTVNEDGTVTISSSGSGGIKFTVDKTYNYITTVFTVKNLDESAESDRVLVALGGSTGYYTGVYLKSGGLSTGGVNGNNGAWGTATYDGTVSSVADANTTRTFAATQVNAGTLRNGFHLYEDVGNGTSGGTIVYGGNGDNGLYGTQTYDKVLIGGGLSGSTGSLGSMTDLVVVSVAIYVSDTVWPLDSAGRQNFAMPGSFPVSNSTSISVLNSLLTQASISDPMFVNLGANVYLTADARPASNLVFPNDATIALDDTTLTVTGGMPVKPGSSITSVDGSGSVVYTSTDTLPASSGFFADTWTGTVKISGATLGSGSIANLGNANSTIELAGDGLTIDTLSANMTFAGALTGDGTLNVTAAPSTQYTTQFTGNCTAFAGSVTIAQNGKARVAFGNNNIAGNNNCLVVGSDATVTVASGKTWTAPGGFVIRGNMTLSGNLGGGEKVYGDTGVITVTSDSAKTGLTIAQSWTGTVKIAYNPGGGRFNVGYFGSNASATVEIVGDANGAFNSLPCTAFSGGSAPSITSVVKLTGTWTVADGWDNATTTFSKLTGTGNLIVNGTTSSNKAIPYKITRIENFTGAIGGNRGLFTIGTVVSGAEPTVGAKVVSLSNCTKTPKLTGTTVVYNNTEYPVMLAKQTDGLYVASKSPTVSTASDDVVINLTGETISFDSISAASLTVNGFGTINVTGDVNVSGGVTFTPNSALAAYDINSSFVNASGYTLKVSAATFVAGTLNGAATIETTSGVTAAGGKFWGNIGGSGRVSISGNVTSQGALSFSGDLAIADNSTYTIGNRLDDMSVNYILDASDSSTYTADESGNVSSFNSSRNFRSMDLVSGKTAAVLMSGDETHFGGKPYFQFGGSCGYTKDNANVRGYSYIAVTQPDVLSGYLTYYSSQDYVGIVSSAWIGRTYNSNYAALTYQNGTATRTATTGTDTIVSYLRRITASDARKDTIGESYTGAIAEMIGFANAISHEDRVACEMYLMEKWNLAAAANFRPIPATADVSLGSGSTLDLGGYRLTVKSLSGSGTVQNGTLTVTDAINLSAGDVLTLPKTAVFTPGTVAAKIVDTTAGTITLCGSLADAVSAYSTGTLTILQSLTDVNLGTTEISISGIVLADGVSAPTFAANPPYSASYTDGTIANARVASTYVWTPADASTDWASLSNWRIGGVAPATLPGSSDTVEFPTSNAEGFTGWTVVLDSMPTVGAVVVNGDTAFSGARIQVKNGETSAVTGTGTITLGDNAGFYPGGEDNLSLTVESNLKITASENAPAKVQGRVVKSSSGGATVRVNGNLTGTGWVEFGGTRSSTYLNGDNTEFAGHATFPDDAALAGARRLNVYFEDTSAVSSNAVWTIYDYNGTPLSRSGTQYCYRFGALFGVFNNTYASSRAASWIELGGANVNFDVVFNGVNHDDREDKIRKVGTGTMTLNAGSSRISELVLNGGSIVVMAGVANTVTSDVTTEVAGYKVVSTPNYDTDGETVLSTTYTLAACVCTWTDGTGDHSWGTAGNWDGNAVPTSNDNVVFPSEGAPEGGWTVYVGQGTQTCLSMTLNADVTLSLNASQSDWSGINVKGSIEGSGKLILWRSGVNNFAENPVTISCPLVVKANGSDSFLQKVGFNVTGAVEVNSLFVVYDATEFSGAVTLNDGAVVRSSADWYNNNVDAPLTFSGTITVPANATVSFERSSQTITGAVTMGAGSTFTLSSATTATEATFTLGDGAKLVVPTGASVTAANIVSAAGGDTIASYTSGANTVYVNNTVATWVGGTSGSWNTGSNWSTGAVPNRGTDVTFSAGDATTVTTGAWGNGNAFCKSLAINRDVTFDGGYVTSDSDITGKGTMTLSNWVWLNTWKGATMNINVGKLVVANCDFTGNVESGNDIAVLCEMEVAGTVYLHEPVAFSGGISVPAGSTGTIAVSDNGAATITGTVTLEGEDSTLTVPANANVSGATFVCGVNGYKVVGPTENVYSVAVDTNITPGGTSIGYDTEAAATTAATGYTVVLTAAQEEQGLKAGYYKKTVAYDSETGKWVVTAALDERVVGGNLVETATVNVSAGTVTLGAANLKPGLYYRIVSGNDAESMTTEGAWSDYYDGKTAPTLSAKLPTGSAPMYYSVEASDTK